MKKLAERFLPPWAQATTPSKNEKKTTTMQPTLKRWKCCWNWNDFPTMFGNVPVVVAI